ncbi:MAG: hypothetical protein J7M25_16020 [Deltaproteobacteria bacterium]|nr:hypothetical protein [Deltaproteobacteria bacterium]
MVQIDIPAAFIASQFFLDVGRKTIVAEQGEAAKRAMYYKYLFRSVLFAGVVIAPAGIYLLAGYPGWEQIYWTPRTEHVVFNWVNALIPALFVAAIVLAGYLGHWLGYRWITSGKERYLRPTYLGLLGAVAVLVLANYPSFLLMGTYDQYHHDRQAMASVWGNPHGFGIAWIMVMVYFTAGIGFVLYRIRKEGKERGS